MVIIKLCTHVATLVQCLHLTYLIEHASTVLNDLCHFCDLILSSRARLSQALMLPRIAAARTVAARKVVEVFAV